MKLKNLPAEAPASRRVILDAAAHLFSTIGYTEGSMRQIAQRAGMQPASVYYHFQSKDAILVEVLKIGIEHVVEAVKAAVAKLPADANPRKQIETIIGAHLRALHSNLAYTSVNNKYGGQFPTEVDAFIQPMRDEYTRYWHGLLRKAQRTGWLAPDLRISLVRPLIMGMMQRTVVWFDGNGGPIDPLIETVLEMLSGLWAQNPAGARRRNSR
ncbi:MAG: TetR/AcrR family transcriptional regulator [Reyranella sp.]